MSDHFRRVGESPRDARRRIRPELAGRQYVEVVLLCQHGVCPRRGRRVAGLRLATDDRFANFDDAWRDEGPTFGSGQEWDGHELSTAADGHRTVVTYCPGCGHPVQITLARLRERLRESWAPSAWHSVTWPPG